MKKCHIENGYNPGEGIATQEDPKPNANLVEVRISSFDATAHPRVEGVGHHEQRQLRFGIVGLVHIHVNDLRSLLAQLEDQFFVLVLRENERSAIECTANQRNLPRAFPAEASKHFARL